MTKKKPKDREGVVYSTNPEFEYNYEQEQETETLPAAQQSLRLLLDKKARAGKQVTLITGFIGKEDDLKELAKVIKTKCSVGGAVKDGEIIIQGDFREKASIILKSLNYKVRVI
jgi:translation initiation factor 1